MNRALAFVLLAFSAIAFAQAPQIKSGATVYIEPNDGLDTFLAAAMMRYDVPLVVVGDKNKADYIIKSSDVKQVAYNGWSDTSASFTVMDTRTSQIVIALSASTKRFGIKGVAEKCAEQLKQYMKKHTK
jgi:hypothetical protein